MHIIELIQVFDIIIPELWVVLLDRLEVDDSEIQT